MDVRNIQKTGNMYYFYLPTLWCKERKITSSSKIKLDYGGDGSLIVSPDVSERKLKHLSFKISESDHEIIHKLAVALYINPINSFEITLDKEMDFTKLLNQKRLISLESVEIDKKQITSEGSVTVSNPESILKTMIKKIKNLMLVMENNYNIDLVEKYEEEIDRIKMLIEKAVISSLTFEKTTKLKSIELYYIGLISKELERLVDHLIKVDKKHVGFISELHTSINLLQEIIENPKMLDIDKAMGFAKAVSNIQTKEIKDFITYEMERIKQNLNTISEVIMDWMITLKIDN